MEQAAAVPEGIEIIGYYTQLAKISIAKNESQLLPKIPTGRKNAKKVK